MTHRYVSDSRSQGATHHVTEASQQAAAMAACGGRATHGVSCRVQQSLAPWIYVYLSAGIFPFLKTDSLYLCVTSCCFLLF